MQNPFASRKSDHGEVELLRGLASLARQLQSNLDMGAVVRTIATAISDTLGFHEATVYIREPESNSYRGHAAVGRDPDLSRQALAMKVPGEVFERLFQPRFQMGRSYFIGHNEYEWPPADAAYFPTPDLGTRRNDEWHTDDALFVPLYDRGDTLIGVLDLGDPDDGCLPTPERVQTVETFAMHAAVAIVNARQYQQLEVATHDLAGALRLRQDLIALSETLLATLDQRTVFEQIAETLKALVDYDTIDISLVDEEKRELVTIFARDQFAEQIMEFRVSVDQGVSGWVVRHNEAQMINDMNSDPRGVQVPDTDVEPQASIFVPLQVRGKVGGVLIIDRLSGGSFEQKEFETAKLFANLAAIAIQNARSFNEMEVQAISDGLTGLHNYRHFRETLEIATARAARYNESFCLLMMDLDHFKQVNDTVGHQQGDSVLRAVADVLRGCSRESDYHARYGGEEFVMLLPRTGLDEARKMAERVRASVFDIDSGSAEFGVTISIGVASYPESSREADGVLRAADGALLQAKANGRNRVCLFDEERPAPTGPDSSLVVLARRFAERIGLDADETAGLVAAVAVLEFAADTSAEAHAILSERRFRGGSADPGTAADARTRTYEALLYGNERWDGRGYPEGLSGTTIPRVARALAICRTFAGEAQARTNGDPGLARLRKLSSRELDPGFVQRFVALVRESGPSSGGLGGRVDAETARSN